MVKLSEIAEWVGTMGPTGSISPMDWRVDAEVGRVSGVEDATSDSVVFATDTKALRRAMLSEAGVILASRRIGGAEVDKRVVWVDDAKLAFAVIAGRLVKRRATEAIDRRAVVEEGAVLGDGTRVGPGAVIGADVRIGKDCEILANATVYEGTTIGDRVLVQSGAVLGSTGFGYVRNGATGGYVRFPQQGTLVIEDDVEVGANTTIDRGALGETRIGRGTKIDNLVHIAHNCVIGRDVVIAAQTGISGSTVVGDGAVIGGQVGIGDHAVIGEGVILGSGSGVLSSKRVRGAGEVFWGIPAQPLKEYLRDLARFRRG